MTPFQRNMHWFVLGLAGLYLGYCAMPARHRSPFDLDRFGSLPIAYNGRPSQPLDSLARNALTIVSGRQTFTEETPDGNVSQPAIRWLLDMWCMSPIDGRRQDIHGLAANHKFVRIENEQVIALLGLEPRPGLRYSLAEIQPGLYKVIDEGIKARKKEAKTRTVYELKVMELVTHLQLCQEIITMNTIYAPPDKKGEAPQTIGVLLEEREKGFSSFWGDRYHDLISAYAQNRPAEFDNTLSNVYSRLEKDMPAEMARARFESFFNRFEPFYRSMILYVFVILLAIGSWLYCPEPLRRSAFTLCILTLVVHTGALVGRMYLMERWGVFVTNLYSSAIFIGWGCVAVGLFLEYVFPLSIGCVVGAVTGALSLFIAPSLATNGDTLEMLQAVLDTNFWLATHVTCITFGYTATFLAGFMGAGYVLANLFAPQMPRETSQVFTRMIYGVICFATLLSFTGTVLGGIWADQSWGRFWGWDPKENGALLIVLMNALTLHARWAGMIKARGLAVLAILGNIVTAWSWFGVNMLGVGLHAYGFMDGAVFWLVTFVVSQLLLAGLGMFDPAMVRKAVSDLLALTPPPPPQEQIKAPGV